MNSNGWRWGLVTFCGCITCGVIGASAGSFSILLVVTLVAIVVSAFGGLAIGEEKP